MRALMLALVVVAGCGDEDGGALDASIDAGPSWIGSYDVTVSCPGYCNDVVMSWTLLEVIGTNGSLPGALSFRDSEDSDITGVGSMVSGQGIELWNVSTIIPSTGSTDLLVGSGHVTGSPTSWSAVVGGQYTIIATRH